uniref:TniQ family protein n=1 Tax=uncultured Amnibacterium sp. TaxID=1631851 RepID=UPI0035CC12BB
MDWPLLLRPLPRPVAPVTDETLTSYLARLADANRLEPAALRHLLSGSRRKDGEVPFAALTAVSGMPPTALAYAMPQTCAPPERAHVDVANRPRPHARSEVIACRPCTASAAGGRVVTIWALHDHVVCRRHRRWLSDDDDQPDLSRQPEILDAARRHRWLIRRHGRDAVMRAYRDARHICLGWRLECYGDEHEHDPGYTRRMRIFHGQGWPDVEDDSNQTFHAANYPQVVSLTRLLASPYWRSRILDRGWPQHDEFINELRRTVAPDYIWSVNPRHRRPGQRDDRYDPLLEWKQDTRYLEYQPLPPDSPWQLPETLAPPDSA